MEKMKKIFKNIKIGSLYKDSWFTSRFLKDNNYTLQKLVIFLSIFIFSLIAIWNVAGISFENTSKSKAVISQYKDTFLKLVIVFGIIVFSWTTLRFLSISTTRSWISWIIIAFYLLYSILMLVFLMRVDIFNIDEIKKHFVPWLIPILIMPALIKPWSILINWYVAPIQTKLNFYLVFTSIGLVVSSICGFVIMIDVFASGETFTLSETKFSVLISIIIIFSLLAILASIVGYLKIRSIKQQNRPCSVPLNIFLPIMLAIAIWGMKAISNHFEVSWQFFTTVALAAFLLIICLSFRFFATGELRSSKLGLMIFILSILVLWVILFVFSRVDSNPDKMLTVALVVFVGTVIFIMFLKTLNFKLNKLQDISFVIMMVCTSLSFIIIFLIVSVGMPKDIYKIIYMIFDPLLFVLGLGTLGPTLFALCISYGLIVSPFLMRKYIKIESKIQRKIQNGIYISKANASLSSEIKKINSVRKKEIKKQKSKQRNKLLKTTKGDA